MTSTRSPPLPGGIARSRRWSSYVKYRLDSFVRPYVSHPAPEGRWSIRANECRGGVEGGQLKELKGVEVCRD